MQHCGGWAQQTWSYRWTPPCAGQVFCRTSHCRLFLTASSTGAQPRHLDFEDWPIPRDGVLSILALSHLCCWHACLWSAVCLRGNQPVTCLTPMDRNCWRRAEGEPDGSRLKRSTFGIGTLCRAYEYLCFPQIHVVPGSGEPRDRIPRQCYASRWTRYGVIQVDASHENYRAFGKTCRFTMHCRILQLRISIR